MYTVIFESIASEDVFEAKKFYREKVSDDLADSFYACVKKCITDLKKNPYLYQKRIGDSRFAKVSMFPFVVVYVIEEQTIIVDAVYCTKRGTSDLLKRL